MTLKETFGQLMIGRKAHFTCDCIFKIDVVGTVKSFSIINNEIALDVITEDGKYIQLFENHPNLMVTFLDV